MPDERERIRTSVNVPPARMRVLRRLAADLGLYVSRGPAAGQAGNVAGMLNRLVDVYERNPGGTRALLRALLDIAPPADGD